MLPVGKTFTHVVLFVLSSTALLRMFSKPRARAVLASINIEGVSVKCLWIQVYVHYSTVDVTLGIRGSICEQDLCKALDQAIIPCAFRVSSPIVGLVREPFAVILGDTSPTSTFSGRA